MPFRLVKTGKSYAEGEECIPTAEAEVTAGSRGAHVLPIIWETGNVDQIRSLLVLREAELVVAKAQLTGVPHQDWYAQNRILDLEIKITDLRRWLTKAMEEKE